ncbi:MAG: hypothetical protein R6U52_01465 [Kosmotogaceae bacterium]
MSDNAIVREYSEQYQDAWYACNPFYPLADRDLRAYLGDQWNEQEKQMLFDEGRNAYVFNLIRKNINLITGYQRKHRLSSVVVPIENSDQLIADQYSQLLLYALNSGEGYHYISEAFGGALKTGINLLNIWMDYRDDPINGDIKYGRDPYCGFITDPYWTKLDFSDCSYVIKRKYLSYEQACSLLPGQEKDLKMLVKQGWSRDDKFNWLPYQRQPDGEDFLAYNEYYKQGWEMIPAIVDEETGEYTEWEGNEEGLRFFLQNYPQLKLVKRPKQYIESNIIVNDTYMRTERNQYGLNEYPFVPLVGIFEPECELWDLKLQSLVRPQIDSQKEANRRRSQMIDILDSNINSGWVAKKSAVVNPRSLYQSSQGKVVFLEDDAEAGDITKIQPAQLPQGMFELQRQFDQDTMTIMGINDANFGMTENAQESGIMMMLRQGASIVNLQDIFDNLRYAQKQISKKTIKLIQTWKPEKIQRIINQQVSENFFDMDATKYDVSIQEGVLTDTQKQIYFHQLTDLYQLTGGPQSSVVTPTMLAKAAPLQGKSQFNQEIEQNQKMQQQQAQEQQQIAQQKLQSELEYNKAASIDKLAMAQERKGRTQSDLALSTERISESEQNRAQAALDKAKTMVEISKMNDERIMQVWRYVNELERQEITDRELIGQKVSLQAKGIEEEVEKENVQSPSEKGVTYDSLGGL